MNSLNAWLREYLNSPDRFWPSGRQRHARRVEAKVRIALESSGLPSPKTIDMLCDHLAQRVESRLNVGASTIHLANIGSSGSHWLQLMLKKSNAALMAAEVYFPPSIKSNDHSEVELRRLVEALHLLYADPGVQQDHLLPLVTSAHQVDLLGFNAKASDLIRVLLIRDPIEIVMSRTFRKDGYRNDVASELSDRDYLILNARKVKRFFKQASKVNWDYCIRYEKLKRDPFSEVVALLDALSLNWDSEQVKRAISETDADRIRSGEVVDKGSQGNLYMGKAESVPDWAYEVATMELAEYGEHNKHRG